MSCKQRWSRGLSIILILAVSLPVMAAPSGAEKLIGKVPGKPLMVMSTSGLAEIQPAFDKTFLGKVSADKNMQKFVQDIFQQVIKLAGEEMPDANIVNQIKSYVFDVAQSPVLLGVSELDAPTGPVPVYGYLYIDGSKNKEKVQALLDLFNNEAIGEDDLIEKDVQGIKMYGPEDDDGLPGYWGWVGDVLVLAINDAEGLAAKALKSSESTKIAALDKLPAHGDAFIEYISYGKMLDLMTSVIPQEEAQVKQIMSLVFEKTGVKNIDTIAFRSGFKGNNFVMDSYAGLKGPRTGLQAYIKPVNEDLLAMVPAQAMTASVSHYDIPGVFDMAVKVADEMTNGQGTAMVDMGVMMVQSQFGVDVKEAIIKNLDGPMLGYSVPEGSVPGVMSGGSVCIVTLKDTAAFTQVLTTLEKIAQPLAQGQFQPGTQEIDGHTLHTWAIGPLAIAQMVPTWTMVDNHLVLSTDTALCAAAAKQVASKDKAKSLLSNASYKKASAGMPDSALSISYVDTQNQMKQMMAGLKSMWPMGAIMLSSQGVQLPMMFPTLDHLMTDLEPACNYSIEKDGGIYGHAESTGIEMAIGAGIGAGVGFAMPIIKENNHGIPFSLPGMTEMVVPMD